MNQDTDQDADVKLDISLKKNKLKDRLTDMAAKQLAASSSFKKSRTEKWKKFDDMYNGKVQKKLRQMFNVPLPIFSGMLDTLAASYDEPVTLNFVKKHPADHFKAKRTNAMWNMEKSSTSKDARWDYKSRLDKRINLRYGRSIMKYFAESDPKYRSVLKIVNPYYFHCQPLGGGHLENHLFCGEENVYKSETDIERGVESGIYDKDQVALLKLRSNSLEYMDQVGEAHKEAMARFQSLGMDPEKDNYVGEKRYNLVEWYLTYKGKRWYVLFDAWTKTWLRVEPLKKIQSKELYPYTSWASHEDDAVFWTIGYGDILYPVADAMTTLFNQELTNREKKNFNARMYDPTMISNVAAFDKASYRADAIIEVNTQNGAKDISKATFSIPTAELSGTVQMIDWMRTGIGKDTGITDIAQGAAMDASKKTNVAFLEQAAVAKRIGYKSQSYSEAWGEIGTRYVMGLKDHMTGTHYIEVLGEEGIEPDVMSREDLYTKNDLGVKVISSTAQKAEMEIKKKGRIDAINMLKDSQNVNSEMRDATILRDIGGYTEEEIKQWFDTKNFASRDSMGKAHIAIQELLTDSMPETNFAADAAFIKTISDYAIEHRNKLGMQKFMAFMKYFEAHTKIAEVNETQRAKTRGQQAARQQMQGGAPSGGAQGSGGMAGNVPAGGGARPEQVQK